ncbi:hypothetical protein TKK_0014559 [Trichogramma kaykai]
MRVTSIATIQITLQNQEFELDVFVAPDLGRPFILGLTWLREERAVVDLYQDVVHLGKRFRCTVPLIPPQGSTPKLNNHIELENGFPKECQKEVRAMLESHSHILTPTPGRLTRTTSIRHEIRLTNPTPFRLPPYRYSDEKKLEIDQQVKGMLDQGIIETCVSPYSSPIVLAKKKDGTWRFCIDYRRLNSLTEDSAQPIPRISDTLKELGDSKVFSTLDLKSGYWQVPLAQRSKPLTAFSTPSGGTYQFNVMPFGLKGAPGTFQRLMAQEVLTGYLGKFCICYLDDIIIHSKTYEEHLHHLSLVLERLSIHNLTCCPEKLKIGLSQLEYLGSYVTDQGNEAKKDYLRELQKTPPPTTIKQLQSFVGACNWLHEYVKDLATSLAPLTGLLKKRTLHWTAETQQAFEKVKERFKGPLRLSRPSPGQRFILQTDASGIGMGAVLLQQRPDQQPVIIAYASAKLTPTEQRYHCNEQECLAVIWGIKRFRHYLEDAPFTLRTDSKTLIWLDRFKETRDKLLRWALLLQEFQFTIEHCAGKDNELPDLLSRNPLGLHDELEDIDRMMPPESAPSSVSPTKPQILMVELAEPLIDEIIRHQQHDEKLAQLATHSLQGNSGPYQLEEGALWYEDPQTKSKRLTVPLSSRKRVLFEFHDQIGHPGEDETIRSIASRFHWPGQSNSVREHVKLCHICACGKKAKTSPTDMRPHQPTEPWKTIAVDFMGPYPITARRKRFILVVTDLFSRWTEAFAMTASDTPKLIKLLEEEVFGRWGYPQSILSDNGPQFRSLAWKQACEKWQCRLYTTAIYSPRANPTERRNQEIKKGLRLHLMGEQHNQWDLKLPSVLYDLRCRKNAATGVTPAHLLLGKELSRPGDWKLQLRAPAITERHLRVAQAQLQQAKYQAKYASVAPNKFPIKPGDLVYAKTHPLSNAAERYHAGFEAKWEGPFAVTNQLSEDVFELDKHGSSTKTHRSELRPNSSGTQLAITAPSSSDPIPTTVQSDQTPTTPGSDPIPATPSSDPIPTTAPSDPTPIQSDSDQVLTTSSSDAHPTATPEKEGREKEDDGSAERQHRYNLRRRK